MKIQSSQAALFSSGNLEMGDRAGSQPNAGLGFVNL